MKNMTFSSNEIIDYSQATKKTFGSRKIFLLIMAILACVLNLALLVVFAISGHGGLAIPIVLLILDALFITGVCLSNFRFKYSIGIWAGYLVISIIVTSILATLDSGEKYMTDTAKYLNVFAHIALYLVTLFASIYPLFKNNVKLKAAMITAVSVAVVLVGAFTVYFSANGYFGQGFLNEYRVVGYTLDENSDTYIATSIKKGRSQKVVIPEEFDGKKVSGVDCSIFIDGTISFVDIQSKDSIDFVGTEYLSDINENLKIGVDKKHIDEYRAYFLYGSIVPSWYITLSNNFYPINLDADERYITFAYQEAPKRKDIVPTWIGKAGQTFNLDYANIDYISHGDATKDGDLIWCFENNNRKILSGEIVECIGKKIDGNKECVGVDFANVYRVQIADDNDTLYESPVEDKITVVDNKVYDYRFVTLNSADFMLANWTTREGFDIGWLHKDSETSYYPIVKFSDKLANYAYDTITIYPEWVMKTPDDLQIIFDKDSYVYGDNVDITATAKAPNSDCVLEYKWIYNGNGSNEVLTNSDGKYSIINAYPQYGTFLVYVTASSPKSSLTSNAQTTKDLTVGRRPLNITWKLPEDMVYDAQPKTLSRFTGEGELINGDTLVNNIYETNITNTNAGQYTASLELLSNIRERYYIASGSEYKYTIAPRPTQAVWSSGDYTYDGHWHNASAAAQDINGSNLSLSISDGEINAGIHTAKAESIDTNYVLSNPTYEFEIKQKSITVSGWVTTPITYSGYAQHPNVARVEGLVGNDNISSQYIYTDYSSNIDAGEGYTVKVELPSTSNYKFDSVQITSYNIGKRDLHVRVFANNKTYDGAVNNLDFQVDSGLASVHTKSSLGTPVFSGSGVNATDVGTYSVSMTLPNNSVTKNYNITYTSTTFNISKAQVALNWSSVVVNNGVVTPPRVMLDANVASQVNLGNYVYKDSTGRIITSIPYKAGTYSVEVNPTSNNYTFTNTRINFTVTINEVQSGEVK